jgi:hypothetical protein
VAKIGGEGMKLEPEIRHLMALVERDADVDGWVEVSHAVWPHIKRVPDELLELAKIEGSEKISGKARLTDQGKIVLKYT